MADPASKPTAIVAAAECTRRLALVRRDPRPREVRNRDASGNTTLPLADLFATEAEAFDATMKTPRKRRSATGRAGA